MAKKKRSFFRPLGNKRYKKLFIIAVEGSKTEPEYFALFNEPHSIVRIRCLKGNHNSSPLQVLKRMKLYLRQESLRKSDEAWLVVDKDEWTNDQLNQLHAWSNESSNFGFALSNPKFEYWLLLHFEDGNGTWSARECLQRLKKHLPNYEKGIDQQKISRKMILMAMERAKKRDIPQCSDWPRKHGSTVYRLIERILNH